MSARLVEALHALELGANTVARCYSHNPGNFAAALRDLGEYAEAARAALAEAEAQPVQEPVARMDVYAALQQAHLTLEELQGPGFLIGGVMRHRIGLILPKLNEAMSALAAASPQPVPLTDEQIRAIHHRSGVYSDDPWEPVYVFARAIERAHGIGGRP